MTQPAIAALAPNFAIVEVLQAVAENRPRVHGNGFIQIDLTPAIRLHVWGDPRIPKQASQTPIHDHAFGFTSYVLFGRLEHVVFQTCDGVEFQPHRAKVRKDQDTILVKHGKPCGLSVYGRRVLEAGESYSMKPGEIHESIPHGVAVSLIVKDGPSLAQGGGEPVVFVPAGMEPGNDFDRYAADPDLLWQIVADAFNWEGAGGVLPALLRFRDYGEQ